MRIGLLGELVVAGDDGSAVLVTGAKQRALLTILALNAGRPVPADQLVDALWGDDPPPAVRNGLQGLVSKLRRALGATELVAMRASGYVLEVPPDVVDVVRYERLVAGARARLAHDPASASAMFAEAETLWRGDALSEFSYQSFAAAPITRLTELRLAALEERLDAELRLGRHAAAVVELERLVADHPLRERLRALLLVALYRSGRQADALRAYQDGRHALAEELGIDPGPELRQLEAAILAQDAALDAPHERPGAEPTAPPLVAERAIPEPLTRLVGRERELDEVGTLLGEHRLVTLVGPGGVGKTRLAIEVARARVGAMEGGGCVVELAPVGDPAGVRGAITEALGLPDPRRLEEMLGDRPLLLLLDNCEHVIGAAAEVAEALLQRCPGLRLLVTSREGLRVGGEVIWPVPPLPIEAAVALFLARAQAAGARLDRTPELGTVVTEICARLDGLPLAIELAAARTRAFPVHQLASRLHDRFRLLTGGSRTALPRQQTLRAVVDWSYELLFEDEQRVFERLSVFPGGCDLATARAVCADDRLPPDDVEDIIHALVDKSLVLAVPSRDDVRFGQLQTLAQYAREKLARRGDATAIRDAMASHFGRLCARSPAAYVGDEQRAWLVAIDREQDNLRGALAWAVANGDAATALTIAGGAGWTHWLRGTMPEGRRWLAEAWACPGAADAPSDARGLALIGRGLLDLQLGAPDHADDDLAAALAIFEDRGDAAAITLVRSFSAELPIVQDDVEEARRRRRDLLAVYDSQPDEPFVEAARWYSHAKLALLDEDLATAEQWFRKATDGFALIDRPVMRTICLGVVADFDERAGDHRAAIDDLEEAVETNDQLGLHGFMGSLLARLAWAHLQVGEVDRAEVRYRQALDLARRLSNTPVVFLALAGMAAVHRLRGRDDEAMAAAVEALDLHVAGAPRRLVNRIDPRKDSLASAAVCCAVLGSVAAIGGDPERGALLLGHADELRRAAGAPVPSFRRADRDRAREAAIARLGQAAFEDAFSRGQRGELGRDVPFHP